MGICNYRGSSPNFCLACLGSTQLSHIFLTPQFPYAAESTAVLLSNIDKVGLISPSQWGPHRSNDLLLECHLQVWLFSPAELVPIAESSSSRGSREPCSDPPVLQRSLVGKWEFQSCICKSEPGEDDFFLFQISFSWYHFSPIWLTLYIWLYRLVFFVCLFV